VQGEKVHKKWKFDPKNYLIFLHFHHFFLQIEKTNKITNFEKRY